MLFTRSPCHKLSHLLEHPHLEREYFMDDPFAKNSRAADNDESSIGNDIYYFTAASDAIGDNAFKAKNFLKSAHQSLGR